MTERLRAAGLGALTGLAFGAVEVLAALAWDPLGPSVRPVAAVASLAVFTALGGASGAARRWLAPLGLITLVALDLGTRLGLPWLAVPVLLGALVVRRRRALPILAVLTAALPTMTAARVPDATRGQGVDRVLITIDTLRLDAPLDLGPGWTRCPAVAPAPWTLPSVYGLMTGAAVRHHLGGLPAGHGYTVARDELVRLGERHPDASRGAFVHNPHLRQDLFGRGWERFDHADTWRRPLLLSHAVGRWGERLELRPDPLRLDLDRALAERALAWWDEAESGRLLWLHLLGPHEYRRFGDGSSAAYAAHVAETEGLVQQVIARLGAATIVVTSDHGERIEGPSPGHGKDLADDQVLVPLWVQGDRACPQQVALQDVAALLDGELPPATVVELGGVRRDAGAFEARVEDGSRLQRSAPTLPDAVDRPDATWVERLEALGYVDE